MAIKGSLKEASMPDVLQLLSMGKKTGCLAVTHRGHFGYIYFDDGRISHASIVNRPDRLGELMVKSGLITADQLQAAIDAQRTHKDKRLGEILVDLGHLTRETLHAQVRFQIEEAVYQLFTWNEGTFTFETAVRPEPQELLVSITPESLLLEGARRVDEWSVIEQKITSFDIVFEADWKKLESQKLELTLEQQTVLKHLDGKNDIAHVADAAGLAEFEVGKAFYGLLAAGLIHQTGTTARKPAQVRGVRLEEHRNLGVAFYRSGMYEESLREFKRVIEINPEDARGMFYLGLVLARQGKWDVAIEAYRAAVALPDARAGSFHNLAIALERVGRYQEALGALKEAYARGGATDAKIQTSMGVLQLLTGEATAADATFTASRKLWRSHPSAAWYHYAALTAATLGDAPRAESLLKEGIEHHPHAGALHNNLAVVLEYRASADEALAAGERGLAEEPLPQLHKNVGDVYYRATKYDEAFEAYSRAVKADENLGADVYLRLGNIQLRRGQREAAAASWCRAAALDPANATVRSNLATLNRMQSSAAALAV
jgi:tetratricopeptide (TPR) repeat protein